MSDWMTIRVVLTGRSDRTVTPPPGRVLLAHADHAFSDLAEAIDTAFGRWDLTPLHQFEVEGRILVTAGSAEEGDLEAEDSDEVTLGEVGLRTAARFLYVFDVGEGWTHECTVEEIGVDPFELTGEEPDVPVPVFGWGTIPDQYGRRTEDDDEATDGDDLGFDDEADDARLVDVDADDAPATDLDSFDDEDDEDWADAADAAWAVVARALAGVEPAAQLDALAAAVSHLRAGEGSAAVLWAAAGLEPDDAPADDEELWLELAAAAVRPRGAVPLDDDLVAAWGALEPADWAGAVIELVRAGVGTPAGPEELLALIERCPEVEGDELGEEDEALLLDGLEVVVDLWASLGALDAGGALTPLGRWGLPRALERAWDG